MAWEQRAKSLEKVAGGEMPGAGAGGTHRLRAMAVIFPAGLPFPGLSIAFSWQALQGEAKGICEITPNSDSQPKATPAPLGVTSQLWGQGRVSPGQAVSWCGDRAVPQLCPPRATQQLSQNQPTHGAHPDLSPSQ